ncbi:MAG: FxLYD domain-containing protein [Planctomycetota bacterium]|jgi:hypothetical protein
MKKTRLLTVLLASILLIAPLACRNTTGDSEHEGGGEGEEPGVRIAIDETYDAVRRGVRLILNYDSTTSSFVGTVENITDKPVSAVRVEVHLSNGTELGPTERNDLSPGEKIAVKLSAGGQDFDWWKAHAESGEGGEHSGEHEGEHGGEHSGEHEGEHGGEHSGEREGEHS